MRQFGKVGIAQEAFIAALKIEGDPLVREGRERERDRLSPVRPCPTAELPITSLCGDCRSRFGGGDEADVSLYPHVNGKITCCPRRPALQSRWKGGLGE